MLLVNKSNTRRVYFIRLQKILFRASNNHNLKDGGKPLKPFCDVSKYNYEKILLAVLTV